MPKTTLNPDGLPIPRGSYSQVAIAGRLVFLAGQTATTADGTIVGVGDIREQTRYALEKVIRGVTAAGGTADDIVTMIMFITDARYYRDVNEVRGEVFGANFPASTMVQVVALGRPELLLEITATAVLADH
jgi:2-iminobutanoate/2-iminopropanoate deaminase